MSIESGISGGGGEKVNSYSEKLCPVGKSLFDQLPDMPSSWNYYNPTRTDYGATDIEERYGQHISSCPICSKK